MVPIGVPSLGAFPGACLTGHVLVVFHKPYGVLSQFTPDGSANRTLADFDLPSRVYPLGRLDADSEGLLLLTDETDLNSRLLLPEHRHRRTYWAQVERIPSVEALGRLSGGLRIQGYSTLPAIVSILDPQPIVPPGILRFGSGRASPIAGLPLNWSKARTVRSGG